MTNGDQRAFGMAATVARKNREARFGGWRDGMKQATQRSLLLLAGAAFVLFALLILGALASYHSSDPSLNTAAAGPVQNWFGTGGAYLADVVLTLLGPPVLLMLPLLVVFGLRLARGS